MAQVFGPGCESAYKSVFLDESPENWCVLGYLGNTLVPEGSGSGGLSELIEKLDDGKILYGFLRLNKTDDRGDSKRVKFVFITWVGETASPLKKGKVTIHKKQCATLFKGYHIEKQIYEREALDSLADDIDADLKKAGGANYDLGNTKAPPVPAGHSPAMKSESKKFFEQKEQETEIKNIIYDKGPLKQGLTACDIGGRSFVASHTDAKKNTIG